MSNPKFEALFLRVVKDWPETIDASEIRVGPGDRYSIKGLYEISENADASYIGKSDEIITRNVNDAIYEALHKAAAISVVLRPMELRRDLIREIFERRLNNCLSSVDWTEADRRLAGDYLRENRAKEG